MKQKPLQKHFERPTSQRYEFPTLRLAGYFFIIALISAITGILFFVILIDRYGFSTSSLNTATLSGTLTRTPADLNARQNDLTAMVASTSRYGGSVLRHRVRATDFDDVYDPADFIAPALVVTSDGWIAVSAASLTLSAGSYDVVLEGTIYPVERMVKDTFTGINFLKIAVSNKQPAELESALPLRGEEIFSNDITAEGSRKFFSSRVSQASYHPVTVKADQVISSADLNEYITVADTTPVNTASFFFNLQGHVVGIGFARDGWYRIVPAGHIENSLQLILHQKSDLDLGIYYIEPQAKLDAAGDRGITIYHPTRNAVRPGTLAKKISLQTGDRIRAINGEVLDAEHPFQYLWRKYQLDRPIRLTVVRNGTEGSVDISE